VDRLTELVIVYKKLGDEKVVAEILKLSEGLIWGIFRRYKIQNFPAPIQEEIAEDCRSLVLTRAIRAFDESKGARFSTFFHWRCLSHVRSRKEFYLRRRKLGNTVSFDAPFDTASSSSMTLGDVVTHSRYSFRNLSCFKRQMLQIFSES
jgi:hypothetical protein